MPFDAAPQITAVDTERAQFAHYLARNANRVVGKRLHPRRCALANYFGRTFAGGLLPDWQMCFIARHDALARDPTGFDALAILNRIP